MANNGGLIIIGVAAAIVLAAVASKSKASGSTTTPPAATLDISCPLNLYIPPGTPTPVSVPVVVQAKNGNIVSKMLHLVAGTFSDSKIVSGLNNGQITTVTFIIPSVTQSTPFSVSVV